MHQPLRDITVFSIAAKKIERLHNTPIKYI